MVKIPSIKKLNEKSVAKLDKLIEFLLYSKVSMFFIRNFQSVKRLLRWLPVIWKQKDYDFEGMYALLYQKMKDLEKSIKEDTWHDQKEVQRALKQLKVTMARFDRYFNPFDYEDYPIDDISWIPTEDGLYTMIHTSEENEKQRQKSIRFEKHNEEKLWKNFIKWHRNWWT